MHAFADKNADYFVADPEVVEKLFQKLQLIWITIHRNL